MAVHVALLRAINVAGHGRMRMDDLRSAFERAGARDVQTVIQSGNVLYEVDRADREAFRRRLDGLLRDRLGAQPTIVHRTSASYRRMVASAPFARMSRDDDVKRYVAFLDRAPRRRLDLPVDVEAEALTLVAVRGREAFLVSRRKPNGFYGFPNPFVEDVLGVAATSRNWNTVVRIDRLLAD